jgi:hypothetical protein
MRAPAHNLCAVAFATGTAHAAHRHVANHTENSGRLSCCGVHARAADVVCGKWIAPSARPLDGRHEFRNELR